ncbi:MAG: hypothetical protein JXA69_14995 [Phycisphaerae bacterium]|nr:hypothetical protein [Phycisphaerae bacterium]
MARPAWNAGGHRLSAWILRALGGWAALGAGLCWAADDAKTVVVLVTPHRVYREVASSIETAIGAKGHRCVLVVLPRSSGASDDADAEDTSTTDASVTEALKPVVEAKPALLVTVGTPATSIAQTHFKTTPTVFCLVPNALDALNADDGQSTRRALTGVTTDVAPIEQIDWLLKVDPRCKVLGVLHSPSSKRTAEAVQKAATDRPIKVVLIEAQRDEFPKAIDALNDKQCDGALMLADAKVYNSANVQRLLLWGVRQKKAVFAFSANIVKAGALAGQSSENAALVRQTAELASKVLGGADAGKLGLQYPAVVETAINERTAEMIGCSIDDRVLRAATVRFGAEK